MKSKLAVCQIRTEQKRARISCGDLIVTAALLAGAFICGPTSARAQGTQTLFSDDLNSYSPGVGLAGQGGWFQDSAATAPLILSTSTPLGTVAVDGRIRTGTGTPNDSSVGIVRHTLSGSLNPNGISIVSADAYAFSAYHSHNAGIFIESADKTVYLGQLYS